MGRHRVYPEGMGWNDLYTAEQTRRSRVALEKLAASNTVLTTRQAARADKFGDLFLARANRKQAKKAAREARRKA